MQIESLRVAGFLSLKEAEISFDRLNVLIGSNGAGKSNLLRLFELLQALADGSLQTFVARSGGADALLHYGRKHTQQIEIHIRFQRSEQLANGYKCRLIPAAGDILIIDEEFVEFHDRQFFPRPYAQAGHVRRSRARFRSSNRRLKIQPITGSLAMYAIASDRIGCTISMTPRHRLP
jgi:predicted ATPase